MADFCHLSFLQPVAPPLGNDFQCHLGSNFRIAQALFKSSFNNAYSAFPITLFLRIPTAIKFSQIARKMLVADMVERADNAALQQAVIALSKVRVHDDTTNERLAVIDCMMSSKMLSGTLIGQVRVGDDRS